MTRRVVGLLVLLAVAWGGVGAAIYFGLTPRLGLDLQGGTAVVLTAPEGTDRGLIEVATQIMTERIENFGEVQEPEISISGDDTVVVQLPGIEEEQRAIDAVGQTALLSFRPVLGAYLPEQAPLIGSEEPNIDPTTGLTIDDDLDSDSYLVYDEGLFTQVLHVGPAALIGEDVADALPLFDPNTGGWAVTLDLTGEGAEKFARLTAAAAGFPGNDPRRQIAIVLDGVVETSPPVALTVSPTTGITGGRAQITIGATEDAQVEANDLALVLRYGALPVDFEISAVQKVSGTLGADSLQSGIIAGLLGLALVAIVLLGFYRSLGLIAIIGLTVFGSLLVVSFALLGQWIGLTLTLAGVTGIIVSVGITTDSYIVFFERVKEKIRDGYDVVDAAAEGFKVAYRTIWAADTVSLLAAVLLLWRAVGAVKGFAMALLIATILDLVVAPLYTKRAVAILARTRLGTEGWLSIEGTAR